VLVVSAGRSLLFVHPSCQACGLALRVGGVTFQCAAGLLSISDFRFPIGIGSVESGAGGSVGCRACRRA